MKTFTIRVEDEIRTRLKVACQANATTPSQIARKLVTDWVDSQLLNKQGGGNGTYS